MAGGITPDQAAMLIPLLARIASTPKGGHSSSNSAASSPVSFQSTPGQAQILSTPLASSDGESSSGYTVTELLTKKKKNTSSSEPQKYLQYCLRESCKAAGFWDTAPPIEEISSEAMKIFYGKIRELCPQVMSNRKLLRSRLSGCLMNRRAYLRKTKKFPVRQRKLFDCKRRSPQKSTKTSTHAQLPGVIDKTNPFPSLSPRRSPKKSSKRPTPAQLPLVIDKASSPPFFSPGDEIDVYHEGVKIGEAMFVTQDNDMFGRVMITGGVRKKSAEQISLPSVTSDGKKYFNELKVKDIISWRLSKLKPHGSDTGTKERSDDGGDEEEQSDITGVSQASVDDDLMDDSGVQVSDNEMTTPIPSPMKPTSSSNLRKSKPTLTKRRKSPKKAVTQKNVSPTKLKQSSTSTHAHGKKSPSTPLASPKKHKAMSGSQTHRAKKGRFWEYVSEDDTDDRGKELEQALTAIGKRKRVPKKQFPHV